MKDLVLRLILVINGEYKYISKNISANTKDNKKIIQSMHKVNYTTNLTKKYAKTKGLNVGDNTFEWKCPTCAYMTVCPKVLDPEKGSLKKYPFIKNGAQLILINNEKNKIYKDALEEYNKRIKDSDFDLTLDKELAEKLSNTGIHVISTEVYDCENYLFDSIGRSMSKQEKESVFEDIGENYSIGKNNKEYEDSIKADIERIKKLYGKK